MIDKIIYINLEERVDRKLFIEKMLDGLDLKYERFAAIKPSLDELLPESGKYHKFYEKNLIQQARYAACDFLKEERTEFSAKDYKKYLLGTFGCYLSHYRIHEMALHNNWGNYLILEDDVKIHPLSLSMLQEKIGQGDFGNNWDIIRSTWLSTNEYIKKFNYSHPVSKSYSNSCDKNIRDKMLFIQNHYMPQIIKEISAVQSSIYGGTHFQLIKGSSSSKILHYLDNEVIIPIDALYSTHELESYEYRSKVLRERAFNSDIHPTH